jgi:hypothetical protein
MSVVPPGAAANPAPHLPEQRLPAWRRETEGEHRWGIGLAILSIIGLQLLIPQEFVPHPNYIVEIVEFIGLIILGFLHPRRIAQRDPMARYASLALLTVLALVNAATVLLLIHVIVSGHPLPAAKLLFGGAVIWLINVLVFAVGYWEYDRGGPGDRAKAVSTGIDLLFPQMSDEKLDRDWEPRYLDYLFVSFTNSTAFSPTDTMPLSRWTKVMFMLQASVSLVTVALVAARAVNILPG